MQKRKKLNIEASKGMVTKQDEKKIMFIVLQRDNGETRLGELYGMGMEGQSKRGSME